MAASGNSGVDAQRSWVAPPIDDPEILEHLAGPLRALVELRNGFVLDRGALHVRGACRQPAWHSLRWAWQAVAQRAEREPALGRGDVPFAEDALGRQYLLRDHDVLRFAPEHGVVSALGVSLGGFLRDAERSPVELLDLVEWEAFEADGGVLRPGEILEPGTRRVRSCDEHLRALAIGAPAPAEA